MVELDLEAWVRVILNVEHLRELCAGSYYEQKPSERVYHEQMRRIELACQALLLARVKREQDRSPQVKYGEAKLCARRASSENHDPGLDGFQKIVGLLKEACSSRLYEYMDKEVRLKPDKFLDMVHMLTHDQKSASEVANPPARVIVALKRAKKREAKLDMERCWMLAEPEQLNTFKDAETSATVKVDLERGLADLGLSSDQVRLIEAKLDGLGLQESGAPDYLGWNPTKLKSVRRSLEPDRPTGKRLRERFAAYVPQRRLQRFEDKQKQNSGDLS
jgi:hypothetical protein